MTNAVIGIFEGRNSIRIDGRLFDFSLTPRRGGVMARAARQLIEEGTEPDTIAKVLHSDLEEFEECQTLGTWAKGRECPRMTATYRTFLGFIPLTHQP